eukprot:4823763-Ditylum_brightwellii.AAC.1
MATHPDAVIQYFASDMILNIHSDVPCLSEPNTCSTAGGHFFLGEIPQDSQPIEINGHIHILCQIIKQVAASAAEAKLAGIFLNAQQGIAMRWTLEEMGHPQPPTPLHSDNSTAVGIANQTIKQHRSRLMNMRYFWILDQ